MLIQSSFKELVKESMDNYYNEWKKHFLNWKKIIKTHYMAIMNTFDSKAIQRFIQNVINKDSDEEYEEQLNFHAQSMRISGSRPYAQLDTITQSLIQSYKVLRGVFQGEVKKLNERNKYVQSILMTTKLDKIKCGNTPNNGITQYIIDDNDDYPDVIQQPSTKKEDFKINGNSNINGLTIGYKNGINETKNQLLQIPSQSSNSNANFPSQYQNHQVEIDIDIKNYKQIFFTIGNRHSMITKATIRYQTQSIVQQTLENLSLCSNLEELNIEQPLLGTKEMIIFMVGTFTKLKRLYLNCYNDFDDECAYVIMRQLSHIEKLYWGCNFYKGIARAAQLRTWRQHPKMKRKVSLQNQTLNSMVKNLKNLENLWISEIHTKQKTHELFSELKNMPKLKHLSIGQYNVQAQDVAIPHSLWSKLCQIPSLQSIAFIRLNLNDKDFCQLIGRHRLTLRTLVIYKSPGLTDQSFKFIYNNDFKALRELYLVEIGSRQLEGQFVWDLSQIETLVLRGCEFNHTYAEGKVYKMKNLIHLDLKGCEWVSDLFMSSVSKFSNTLQYLNLRNSKVTFHTREHINRLPKLRALDIGYTNINQVDIQNICETNPRIEKISLGGLSGSAVLIARGVLTKGKLKVLGQTLKNCTHLDVSACDRLDDTSLDWFIKLQFVNLWNCKGISENMKNMLREHGVVVFDKI